MSWTILFYLITIHITAELKTYLIKLLNKINMKLIYLIKTIKTLLIKIKLMIMLESYSNNNYLIKARLNSLMISIKLLINRIIDLLYRMKNKINNRYYLFRYNKLINKS